ncbi:hypothetical protein D5F53_11505 [Paenibacillus lautus]|uniref:Uncharacterized protein n=1 Tax=Paenibacillus lautus TaxID=1401 RepID=A0A385TTM2_PAELA|nr:hypothetical protein D5F53_11505 [Paenibacillus lautus]
MDYLGIEELMVSKFHCRRCGHRECSSQEVSMSGTGISKIFGFVEVFNPDVLRGHQSGVLGTVLDLIWG